MRLVGEKHADAFEELYRRHASAVSAVAARVVADRVDADDATQSAFMALWRCAGSFEQRGRSVRAWLVIIGRNAAIDRIRRRDARRVSGPIHEHFPSGAAGPEDIVMERQEQHDIRTALDSLGAEQRAVVELAYFGGLTQSEIAEATGTPLGTVKSRVRLAMRHLRRSLEAPAGDPA
ncbi:DNA-directed RNA polymerase sigma-70 factor [Vulcanimicrobium alpinum]|uniref:DNA-directed RNA polymerase sigma-70 factor n=1 Tax=Vulcanimicrobium alpinum TaxID=3016050 RepID=A0AAN2C8D6_UNVUL|nr:DNA-directed RNA polymerase sigma-70 factor [Vulcanimicrobium alpinum]